MPVYPEPLLSLTLKIRTEIKQTCLEFDSLKYLIRYLHQLSRHLRCERFAVQTFKAAWRKGMSTQKPLSASISLPLSFSSIQLNRPFQTVNIQQLRTSYFTSGFFQDKFCLFLNAPFTSSKSKMEFLFASDQLKEIP